MRISLKIACFIATAVVVALIWLYTPVEKPPEELWTLGFKLRLSGFAVIGLIFFYFFIRSDRLCKKEKKTFDQTYLSSRRTFASPSEVGSRVMPSFSHSLTILRLFA